MNDVREAAERVRRCKLEAPIDVYLPKDRTQIYTSEAFKVLKSLREKDAELLSKWAAEQIAEHPADDHTPIESTTGMDRRDAPRFRLHPAASPDAKVWNLDAPGER